MVRNELIVLRKNNKLTQAEVALATGIQRKHYNRIERGHAMPSYLLACRIKNFFNVDDSIFLNNYSTDTVLPNKEAI